MLLGVLDLTLSVVVQVVAGRVVSSSAVLTQVGTMGPFIAGLCCMIAFAVYKDNIKVTLPFG
ncbi:hypothetical protein DPMN_101428 [Dreissena polymorpha]|uniref:Uncharacterized protein n=1 Tax=Dreissena polymorpha TaxID=45954 RepID=A0A9D4LJX0_DREPO|nr:hypothetical protein DPMN_101428 [Dreissena polymorpha]